MSATGDIPDSELDSRGFSKGTHVVSRADKTAVYILQDCSGAMIKMEKAEGNGEKEITVTRASLMAGWDTKELVQDEVLGLRPMAALEQSDAKVKLPIFR